MRDMTPPVLQARKKKLDMTPPSDREGPDGPGKVPTPMARAMRRWRRRKQEKRRSLRVDLSEEFLDEIVHDGWIKTEQVTNPEILGSVIEDICDTKRRGVFRPGPILTGTATSS